MGKITIDEMHNSLFDYAQAVSDENLMTESKTVVGAINEIYGKKLIANAIGEPLNSTDTYAKMNNDINSLLSTFKTNMMNAGTVVESGDKFKQLIDKIKGLTEGEGNKGIQYATGMITPSSYKVNTTIKMDLDFTPQYVFAVIENYKFYDDDSNPTGTNLLVSNNFNFSGGINYSGTVSINNISNTSFDVIRSSGNGQISLSGKCTWYAFGVGEEDTTLSGGLDIISATELPATGRENQICVITDSSVNQFVITPNNGYRPTDKIVLQTPDHNDNSYNYEYTVSNVTYLLNITRVALGNNRLASYYYNNGWQPLTYQCFPLMENGMIAANTNAIGGSLASGSDYLTYFAFVTGTEPYAYLYSGGTGIVFTRTTSKINFSIYNKITIRCRLSSAISTKFWLGCFEDGVSKGDGSYSSSDFSPLCEYYTNTIISADTNEHILSFDISSWSGTYYLSFGKASNNAELHIYDILFYN